MALTNLHWFHLHFTLEGTGIALFLKVYLIFSLFFFLYRSAVHILYRLHRGLPVALIVVYGYFFGSTGPVPAEIFLEGSPFQTLLWIAGGIFLFILIFLVMSGSDREESDRVPEVSQHLSNLFFCLWISVLWDVAPLKWKVVVTILTMTLALFLILMGRKINYRVPLKRIIRIAVFLLIALSLWQDIPHWPPRYRSERRSVLLITVEGIRPEHIGPISAHRVNTLVFPHAYTVSPHPTDALESIFRLDQSTTVMEILPDHMDREAVLNSVPVNLPPSIPAGFSSIYSTRFSPDSLLALANFIPAVTLAQLSISRPWPEICLRRSPEATTSRTRRVLNSIKEPFFLWVHYSPVSPKKILSDDGFLNNFPDERACFSSIAWNDSTRKENEGRYLKQVSETLKAINDLIDFMDAEKFFPKTRVILSGLNGFELYEHGRFGFSKTLYPEMLHVPLVILTDQTVNGDMLSGDVTVEQVLPTMIHWLGVKSEKTRDLDPSLLSPDESGKDYRIAENRRGPVRAAAVYSNNFALIRENDTGRVMLFNRETDPLCHENIQLLMPEKVQDLINKLGEKP